MKSSLNDNKPAFTYVLCIAGEQNLTVQKSWMGKPYETTSPQGKCAYKSADILNGISPWALWFVCNSPKYPYTQCKTLQFIWYKSSK